MAAQLNNTGILAMKGFIDKQSHPILVTGVFRLSQVDRLIKNQVRGNFISAATTPTPTHHNEIALFIYFRVSASAQLSSHKSKWTLKVVEHDLTIKYTQSSPCPFHSAVIANWSWSVKLFTSARLNCWTHRKKCNLSKIIYNAKPGQMG